MKAKWYRKTPIGMMLKSENTVIQLCLLGTQAEYAGGLDDARTLYRQAWEAARDDYEACVAAHYMARLQETPEQTLHWNQVALARAEMVDDERVQSFYPSLYVNLGRSHELLGNMTQAEEFYQRAAALGLDHDALGRGHSPPE